MIQTLDLTDEIVTGYAIFCQREIASKIVAKGGDYLFPVKGNQLDLRDEISTAFNEPIFPLNEWHARAEADHGRIEQRQIATLPAEALCEDMRERWPSVRSIIRIDRPRSTAKCNISMLWLGWLDRQHLALRSRNGDSSELKQIRNILSCPRATVT